MPTSTETTAGRLESVLVSVEVFCLRIVKNTSRSDGALFSWGCHPNSGPSESDSKKTCEKLKGGVAEIYANGGSFVVIRASDRSMVTLGRVFDGGDSPDLVEELKDNIAELYGDAHRFVAVTKNDGRLVGWGDTSRCSSHFATSTEYLSGDVNFLHFYDHIDSQIGSRSASPFLVVVRRSTRQLCILQQYLQRKISAFPSSAEWDALRVDQIAKIYEVPSHFLLVQDHSGRLFAWGIGSLSEILAELWRELDGDLGALYHTKYDVVAIRNSDGRIFVEPIPEALNRCHEDGRPAHKTFGGEFRDESPASWSDEAYTEIYSADGFDPW